MKRKQMIKLIVETLNNLDDVDMSNYLRADVILSVVEKAGMEPPKALIKRHYDAFGIEDAGMHESYDNKWEE